MSHFDGMLPFPFIPSGSFQKRNDQPDKPTNTEIVANNSCKRIPSPPTLCFNLQINACEMSLCNKTEELAQMENMLRDAESNVQNMLLITASKEDELCLLLM